MAAVEMFPTEYEEAFPAPSMLHVVKVHEPASSSVRGPLVANRRAARARMKARRRRSVLVAAIVASLALLSYPGHAFGGTNGVGLSTDVATSSTLSSGMVYVVQPGDSVASIARSLNPENPKLAQRALSAELRSDVVVVGEHVLIP